MLSQTAMEDIEIFVMLCIGILLEMKFINSIMLSRCDPPSIPYLGIYLSDLTFIEEGTPNFTEKGLLNFAKMRMVRIRLA